MARITNEDGWLVVRFGSDYATWTPNMVEGMVATVADADACLTGRARKIEFRSPTDRLIARADPVRGIRMLGR
jgi:hypothetical protein